MKAGKSRSFCCDAAKSFAVGQSGPWRCQRQAGWAQSWPGMQVFSNPHLSLALPAGHRFPASKYLLLQSQVPPGVAIRNLLWHTMLDSFNIINTVELLIILSHHSLCISCLQRYVLLNVMDCCCCCCRKQHAMILHAASMRQTYPAKSRSTRDPSRRTRCRQSSTVGAGRSH